MSDRIKYLTVVLEGDMRDDDASKISAAILQIKGVLSVTDNVTNPDDYCAVTKAKAEIRNKIYEILR